MLSALRALKIAVRFVLEAPADQLEMLHRSETDVARGLPPVHQAHAFNLKKSRIVKGCVELFTSIRDDVRHCGLRKLLLGLLRHVLESTEVRFGGENNFFVHIAHLDLQCRSHRPSR